MQTSYTTQIANSFKAFVVPVVKKAAKVPEKISNGYSKSGSFSLRGITGTGADLKEITTACGADARNWNNYFAQRTTSLPAIGSDNARPRKLNATDGEGKIPTGSGTADKDAVVNPDDPEWEDYAKSQYEKFKPGFTRGRPPSGSLDERNGGGDV